MKTSMQSTNKPRPPFPSSMDVCDLGGGSGPPRLHTGGGKNLWVKKNHHTSGERLNIATYNVRTLLKDEHVQELEDELKENNMKWDVIGLGEVRRKEESFTTLQSGHLLYHSEANNGQTGVGFLINKKWKDNITRVSSGSSRVAELILLITDRYQLKIVQVYAPTTSHSDEETDNFYNTIDKILEKQTHYTIVMGDFNAKVGGQTNTSERATGCFGLGQRNERGDTLVELVVIWMHCEPISLVTSKETCVACHLQKMPSCCTFDEPCISWLYANEHICLSQPILLPQTLAESLSMESWSQP